MKMIQAVINRLAQNSSQAKNWSVAVVTAILAFSSRSAQAISCSLALFPALCFWILDAYYLRQERLFRALYSSAAAGAVPTNSMDTSPHEEHVAPVKSIMFAMPILLVHGIIFVVIGIAITVYALA
ncbi:MAG: hypothetical protein WA738_20060 [Candidatus Angelobacter sp.]